MLTKPGITTIVLYVRNLDRSRDFYEKSLGLDTSLRGEGDERFMTTQAGQTTLIFFESDHPKPPVPVFELPEGGIENVVAKLAEARVQIVTPVSHAPGGWTADFQDPDGHVLSLYQSADQPKVK